MSKQHDIPHVSSKGVGQRSLQREGGWRTPESGRIRPYRVRIWTRLPIFVQIRALSRRIRPRYLGDTPSDFGITPHCSMSVSRSSSFRLPRWPNFGRNPVSFNRVQAKLGRPRAKFSRAWLVSGHIWPSSGQFWLMLSKCWPIRVWSTSAEFDQFRAKFGRNRAKCVRCRTNVGRSQLAPASVGIGRNLCMQSWFELARNCPTSAQIWSSSPQTCPSSPDVCRTRPRVGQVRRKLVWIAQELVGFGQTCRIDVCVCVLRLNSSQRCEVSGHLYGRRVPRLTPPRPRFGMLGPLGGGVMCLGGEGGYKSTFGGTPPPLSQSPLVSRFLSRRCPNHGRAPPTRRDDGPRCATRPRIS